LHDDESWQGVYDFAYYWEVLEQNCDFSSTDGRKVIGRIEDFVFKTVFRRPEAVFRDYI
jgi:hypothetical protein